MSKIWENVTRRQWGICAGVVVGWCIAAIVVSTVMFPASTHIAPSSLHTTSKPPSSIKKRETINPNSVATDKTYTMFVAIISDTIQTRHTLLSMFTHAASPESIRVCVVEPKSKYQPDEVRAYASLCKQQSMPCHSSQVTRVRIDPQPCSCLLTAREAALSRRQQEPFVLLVDSAVTFATNWDVTLVQSIEAHPKMHLISSALSQTSTGQPPRSMLHIHHSSGDVSVEPISQSEHKNALSVWSSEFSFARSCVYDRVPLMNVPHLPLALDRVYNHARYFTHGVTIHAPSAIPIYKIQSRDITDSNSNGTNKNSGSCTTENTAAVKFIMGLHHTPPTHPISADLYLGTRRTLRTFWERLGIRMEGKTTSNQHNRIQKEKNNIPTRPVKADDLSILPTSQQQASKFARGRDIFAGIQPVYP